MPTFLPIVKRKSGMKLWHADATIFNTFKKVKATSCLKKYDVTKIVDIDHAAPTQRCGLNVCY